MCVCGCEGGGVKTLVDLLQFSLGGTSKNEFSKSEKITMRVVGYCCFLQRHLIPFYYFRFFFLFVCFALLIISDTDKKISTERERDRERESRQTDE